MTDAAAARPEVSRAGLLAQLRALGVQEGGVLLVHTSFRAVRPVVGGPAGLVAALREALGPGGTLVMPSWGADEDTPFDPAVTPAAPDLGVVADTFWRLPGADPVHRVSIVPRGQALGVTYQRPDSDRYNYPEGYLRARIVGMLGGRAAEEIVFGTRTTGAQNDIEQATELARNMVTRWGMSDRLGMVQLAPRENPYLQPISGYDGGRPFSEETARAIDAEVHRIISESHDEARRLLTERRKELDALAEALLARETLDEQEILEVTGLPPAPALDGLKVTS